MTVGGSVLSAPSSRRRSSGSRSRAGARARSRTRKLRPAGADERQHRLGRAAGSTAAAGHCDVGGNSCPQRRSHRGDLHVDDDYRGGGFTRSTWTSSRIGARLLDPLTATRRSLRRSARQRRLGREVGPFACGNSGRESAGRSGTRPGVDGARIPSSGPRFAGSARPRRVLKTSEARRGCLAFRRSHHARGPTSQALADVAPFRRFQRLRAAPLPSRR